MTKFITGILAMVALAAGASNTSTYAGFEKREIKALSQQEIDDYLKGKGMGMAKAAELNHYPGPKHVLDLEQELQLSPEQRQRTKSNFDSMQEQAVALGRQLIDKEQKLDQLFADGSVNTDNLNNLLDEIGKLQATLRSVHLTAHLVQKSLLKPEQIQHYDSLRGYNGSNHPIHNHSH